MNDASREAFEDWFDNQEWAHETYAVTVARLAWHARDAEVAALKARVAELQAGLLEIESILEKYSLRHSPPPNIAGIVWTLLHEKEVQG